MSFLFWIISLLLSIVHIGLILLLAPLVMWFQRWLEAKIQGVPAVALRFYWGEIYSTNIKRLSLLLTNHYSYTSVLPFIALGIVLITGILVPTFTVGMITANIADFILIIAFLLSIPVIFLLIAFRYPFLSSQKKLQSILVDNLLFLPTLLFIVMIVRSVTGSTILDDLVLFFHNSSTFPTMVFCPLLMTACSLFFLIWDIPHLMYRDNMNGFGGEDRGLLLYINDVQFLVWLSLIAFLVWPQSLAVFDAQPDHFTLWLKAASFGLLAWIAKIIIECFILAMMRSVVLVSSGIYRVGISVALSFLAVIVYCAGLSGE